ncbi:hypothetical protein T4D_9633 [Trichinella pseudospiralis]|uniref:Uncharacterized protein n=1 Tax=Trichinella pseudospiralis TaxID=6337 RepID=A0A0V1FR71_TRIPS|nr:hypothetical protein T4D_9633 [Trichinella pseudospiralis]
MSEDRRCQCSYYHLEEFMTKSVAFRGVPFLPVMFSVED